MPSLLWLAGLMLHNLGVASASYSDSFDHDKGLAQRWWLPS
jgi:hypothetical protein